MCEQKKAIVSIVQRCVSRRPPSEYSTEVCEQKDAIVSIVQKCVSRKTP